MLFVFVGVVYGVHYVGFIQVFFSLNRHISIG